MADVIITKLIELVITTIGLIITTVLIPAIATWFKSKANNEKLKGMADDISRVVATCVNHCEQTMVMQLKADGKWDSESQSEVLSTVVLNVLDNLLSSTKDFASQNNIDLPKMVEQCIESYIQENKE